MSEMTVKKPYRDERKDLYPDVGDQLDALWKAVMLLTEDGELLPDSAIETKRMITKIRSIKESIPKQEG